MSFTSLRRRTGPAAGDVRVTINGDGVLRLAFMAEIAEKAGWKAGLKLGIALGEGPDLGLIRIAPAEDGWGLIRHSNAKSYGLQTIQRRPPFHEPRKLETCPSWKLVAPGTVEIMLPEWAGRPPPSFEDAPEARRDVGAAPRATTVAGLPVRRVRDA